LNHKKKKIRIILIEFYFNIFNNKIFIKIKNLKKKKKKFKKKKLTEGLNIDQLKSKYRGKEDK
jgi:hypothetical protein